MANITPRTIVAPAAAFTMACLLFTYTRSSIRQAKANAKSSRDAQLRSRPSYPEEPAPPGK
ncbi:hypothetical protein PspLS_02701 [Pyricularia sp. CBS 133598]|nr:hypothetical protein PspLS_02701 [Pyricularia sp. CBS 133598]